MTKKPFSPEQIILLIALAGFIVFVWMMVFLLTSVRANRSVATLYSFILPPTATPGFVLPATWTPTPVQPVEPTPTGTNVAFGMIPTRIYTPRPTSLPGIPLPDWWPVRPPPEMVLDLARIMQGESPGDKEAAYMVGWVAKNRLIHEGYGDTYYVVSSGFFGYRPYMQPNDDFMKLARRVIKAREDPTGGCLYALSRTDITKLDIPASRADVAYGEWFFFRTWPLSAR